MRNWRKESKENGPGSSGQPPRASAVPPTPRRVRQVEVVLASPSSNDASTLGITDTTFFESLHKLVHLFVEEFPSEPFFTESWSSLNGQSDSEKAARGRKYAAQFHKDFKAYYPLILQKSDSVFALPHPLFTQYKALSKWTSLPEESRTKVWDLSSSLVQTATLSSVLSKCSSQMLSTLTTFSGDVFAKMKSGELDLSSMMSNPAMIMSLMSNKLNVSEIEEFGRTLSEDGDAQTMMMTMMSAMSNNGMPIDVGKMAGLAESMGGIDLASVLSGMGLGGVRSDMDMD